MQSEQSLQSAAIEETTRHVITRCHELGFALAGVCEARPSDFGNAYRAWIRAGKQGEMSYLARNIELRLDPRALVPGARSMICVGDRYWKETSKRRYPACKTTGSSAMGRIARYARGDDYHKSMKKRLQQICDWLRGRFPDHTFRACVDTAPVLEREHAQRAGLGAVGKHTLLIERGIGSYFFLGEIVTTLPLVSSQPAAPDPCGSCTRCIDACPTDAITPWSVDASKCISYLTIEHRAAIAQEFHESMGDWIFGCDICQEVCPHNTATRRSKEAAINPVYTAHRDGFDLLEVLNWSEEDRRKAFQRSAMKRAKLDMMQRNARIALSNKEAHDQ